MLFPLLTICSLLIAAGFAAVTWSVMRAERQRAEARVAALGAAIDNTVTRGSSLFDVERRSAVQGAPLTKLAAGFAAAIVIIVVIAMMGGRPRTTAAHPSTPAAVGDVAATTGAPLELVSMRHERAGEALTVTGLVRNSANAPERGLIAVVFAFDRDGNFLSSARAPIEFVTLASGDESPFRVTIPNAGEVGRYRVSFRTEAGIVRHLDRRPSAQASAN
jgi:hypothetical protein